MDFPIKFRVWSNTNVQYKIHIAKQNEHFQSPKHKKKMKKIYILSNY